MLGYRFFDFFENAQKYRGADAVIPCVCPMKSSVLFVNYPLGLYASIQAIGNG